MKAYKSESHSGDVPTPENVTALLYDYLMNLHNEVQTLRRRVEMLEEINVNNEWLTREQAMDYLSCKSTKLWALSKANKITRTDNGKLYQLKSCRDYLLKNCISEELINERLIAIIKSKKSKK